REKRPALGVSYPIARIRTHVRSGGESRGVPMSSLRAGIDEYPDDVAGLAPERVEAEFDELAWVSGATQAKRLARLGFIDRHHTYAKDGYLSTVSWLCARFGLSPAVAAD